MEPAADRQAEDLIRSLTGPRSQPASVKGIGALRLRTPSGLRAARLAWIVAPGGRIRLEVLGPGGGSSVMSLATDGSRVTGMIHGQGRFFDHATADPDLERIVGVPIRASHLAALLMGRVPVIDYQSTALETAADGGILKIALSRWWRVRQTIFMDAGTREPLRVAFFDTGGTLIYEAAFDNMQTVGRYRIPRVLSLSGGGTSLQLTASRLWTDVAISPELFVMTPAS
ncbi:MAG: DUF4292 domain-containing protein [Desulfobacterales bacterium]|nr:DUF4292 domain-containing protein [Desulfobacterales bacterium]